jgi:hypothetical protein
LLTALSYIENPSWCFDVMTMYFIPASFAIRTHSAALNLTGSKRVANFSYSARGMFAHDMIHSPISVDRLPWYSPAGTA